MHPFGTTIGALDLLASAVAFLAIALFLAACVALGMFLTNRRERALERFALYSGFSFEAEWLPELDEDGQRVITKSSLPELAATTDTVDWTNVLRGRVAGFDTVLFDCRLSYSDEYTANQTVAAFMLSERVLPKFVIRHEEWTDKLLPSYTSTLRALEQRGFQSFHRLRDKESKGWRIFAENETELQHFLTEPMMDLFDQLLEDPCCIESDGHWLLVYVMSTLAPARKIGIFLDETSQIAARVYQAALGARPG